MALFFRKNITLFYSKFILIFLPVAFYVNPLGAQTIIFSENMGTTGAAANPVITSFSSFQNSGCSYTYSGTGDVRNNTASSGYTGSSGTNNVFLDNGSSRSLVISGINTIGYTALSLSYGVYCSGFFTGGGGLTVETSTNGINYTALTRPGNFWVFPDWFAETCTGTIPNTPNLFIRFRNASGGSDFRIDDISLSGTIVPPTNPTPYNGWPAAFTFNNWAATNTAGTYPANMIFHYGTANIIHPSLAQITASQNYGLAYNLAFLCESEITGQGANGVSFVNTNPGNATAGSGNLGESVLALNTSCRTNINVSWRAGTITNNGNTYKLRAQYRVGTTGAYTDLPNTAISQIEYTSNSGTIDFGPVILPAACNNQAIVHLRWAFYNSGAGTGTGDEIFLTNINVASDHNVTPFSVTGGGSYCSGGTGVAIGLSSSQAGVNYQLKNGATNVGSPIAGTGSAISFGNQTTAATYTVLGTNALTSCTNAMSGNAVITINPLPSVNAVSSQFVCGGKNTTAINFSSPSVGATFTWTNSNTAIGLGTTGSGNIASYTSPVISSPPNAVGTISVAATLSGCTGTVTSFSITIKGPQPTSVWNGTVSTDWFDSNNWSNCVCGSVTSATIPSIAGPNFNPVIAGSIAANVNAITLNTGSNLSFQTTQTLNVYGNWINNGSFNAQQGNVNLTGSALQTLSGTATATFYDLTLNNTAGATLSSAQQIQGSLQLNAGTFNTNNQLTLISDAVNTGKIGPINAAADIINQVTIQRYAPGGATGWALLGSPVSSGLTMSSWNDDFFITCSSCPNGSLVNSVPFTSIYSYNETIAGTYSASAKYIPITTISNNIANGSGYWVYLGTSTYSTNPINIDVTGTVAKSSCLSCSGAVTIPVSKTTNNGLLNDGWNLIANPLPSPISWAALRNGNASVDNAVYAFNADLNGGFGAHTTYVNGVSSHVTGGITDVIPMCQGFYIHATASTVLTANESIKVNANPVFLKAASTTPKPIVRLLMNGSADSKDLTTFYFEQGGTTHFQTDFDAYKMIFDESLPYISSMSDSILTSISGLPPLNSNLTLPVKAITPVTDSYTFSLLKTNFPEDVCVSLYDAFTGITTNILTSDYVCTLYDTTNISRFTISFFSTPLAGTSNALQPSCIEPQGLITAVGNNAGPWNYEWKNGNTIVKTSLNKTTADSLTSPNGGNYTVKINTVGQCDNYNQGFAINSIQLPTAAFSLNTNTASVYGQVNFTDQSLNSQSSYWDFGDGIGTSNVSNPVYSYSLTGNYNVVLIAQSVDMCTDTANVLLSVVNDVNGIPAFSKETNVLLFYENITATYFLSLNFSDQKDVVLTLLHIDGKIIRTENYSAVVSEKLIIDTKELAKGTYLLKVSLKDKQLNTFKLVK